MLWLHVLEGQRHCQILLPDAVHMTLGGRSGGCTDTLC